VCVCVCVKFEIHVRDYCIQHIKTYNAIEKKRKISKCVVGTRKKKLEESKRRSHLPSISPSERIPRAKAKNEGPTTTTTTTTSLLTHPILSAGTLFEKKPGDDDDDDNDQRQRRTCIVWGECCAYSARAAIHIENGHDHSLLRIAKTHAIYIIMTFFALFHSNNFIYIKKNDFHKTTRQHLHAFTIVFIAAKIVRDGLLT
jgi:hypothetical protein